jgi:hypothetical protein
MAAGTVTITETIHTTVKKIKFAWTSGTGGEGGTASGTTTYAYDGKLELLTTDPGATAPSDDYDITITDSDSIDVLAGAGANRDTANTEQVLGSSLGAVAGSKLTINITNAGDAKVGTAYLYIR